MKNADPTLAMLRKIFVKSGSFGTKHIAIVKKTKSVYFAGQPSRFAVLLQTTAVAAMEKNINALKPTRYTPDCPAQCTFSVFVA
mmetsp:Transcript_14333/g.33367  ORF Transcript_14333/g.33367 Transcript_14333/m.33367 type:complete len:84 (+) Transcript_14333:333-584(+)